MEVNTNIERPLVVVGVDPGLVSGWGVHCHDLSRDFARGYAVPHDWHWGQCKGVDGRVIQSEMSLILDLIAAYYAAEWTNGDEADGEPLLVLRGIVGDALSAHQWIAYPELHFYIEDQFINDDRRLVKKVRAAKQRDALKTATSKGRWLGVAETFGFATHEVHPTKWREAQLGKGWGYVPREQAKTHAVGVANQLWGLKLKRSQDHGAEARLITEYGWVEQKHERLLRKAAR
jgi:hypothetical protein